MRRIEVHLGRVDGTQSLAQFIGLLGTTSSEKSDSAVMANPRISTI